MIPRRPNLPTLITITRLALSPFVVLLFWLGVRHTGYGAPVDEMAARADPLFVALAFVILLAQEASDIVDGELARRNKAVTDFGKLLDPLADTMSHVGALMCLLWVGLVPLWLLLIVYYREAVVATLRVLAAKQGVVVAARASGKVKSLTQAIAATGLFGTLLVTHYVPALPLALVAEIVSWIVGVVTLFSLVDYFRAIRALGKTDG